MLKHENGLPHHCYGVVVSKKVHKTAVKRNRLRRQIYESIRLLEQEGIVPSEPASDIVLLARTSLLDQDFGAIKSAIQELFTQ
jgi:ribonuclease P protein component